MTNFLALRLPLQLLELHRPVLNTFQHLLQRLISCAVLKLAELPLQLGDFRRQLHDVIDNIRNVIDLMEIYMSGVRSSIGIKLALLCSNRGLQRCHTLQHQVQLAFGLLTFLAFDRSLGLLQVLVNRMI